MRALLRLGLWFGALTVLHAQGLVVQDTFQFPVNPTFHGGGTDVWGYVDSTGTRYCLMGTLEGVAVVDVTNLQFVQLVQGPTLNDNWYHRDIETYGHYAYVAQENTGYREGVMILDLSTLPDSVRYVGSYISPDGTVKSHNLYIDTATGYMYVVRDLSGLEIVSLQNPEQPQHVGFMPFSAIHDVYARNDTVLVAEEGTGYFSMWDLSDKLNPVLRFREMVPETGFGNHIVHTIGMGDGIPVVFVGNEDMFDPSPLKFYQLYPGDSVALAATFWGGNAIAHNVFTRGSLLYVAFYTYGASVIDYSNPGQPVELAHYDTYPPNDENGIGGAWGIYAFSDSTVCVGNTDDILYVFRFQPVPVEEQHPRIHRVPILLGQPPHLQLVGLTPGRFQSVVLLDAAGRIRHIWPLRNQTEVRLTWPTSLPGGIYRLVLRNNQKGTWTVLWYGGAH